MRNIDWWGRGIQWPWTVKVVTDDKCSVRNTRSTCPFWSGFNTSVLIDIVCNERSRLWWRKGNIRWRGTWKRRFLPVRIGWCPFLGSHSSPRFSLAIIAHMRWNVPFWVSPLIELLMSSGSPLFGCRLRVCVLWTYFKQYRRCHQTSYVPSSITMYRLLFHLLRARW